MSEPREVPPATVDEARSLLALVHDVAERADTKAAILIAAFTAAVAGEAAVIAAVMGSVVEEGGAGWAAVLVLVLVSLGCVVAAAVSAALAVRPALGVSYEPPAGPLGAGDLAYFGRLRRLPPERIAAELDDATRDGSMLPHYAEQIHVNSNLVWHKHVLIRRALGWFGAAAVAGALALVGWLVVELTG
jgi:hypothetical protein